MNNSVFQVSCNVFGATQSLTIKFQSEKSFVNHAFVLVFNAILIFPTTLLNAFAVATISKCPQLKSKPCYFIILVQSTIDLGVGIIGIPLFLIHILSKMGVYYNCVLNFFGHTTIILMIDISTIVISIMTLERYIAVLHPFAYTLLVTKKRILWSAFIGSLVFLSVVTISLIFRIVMEVWIMAQSTVFLFFTAFAYTRIFMVVKDLSRSEQKVAVTRENFTKKKLFIRDIKHAKSCFKVALCFVTLYYMPVMSVVSFKLGKTLNELYLDFNIWAITLGLLISSVNSVIFFWTKTVLRKEAAKILKNIQL